MIGFQPGDLVRVLQDRASVVTSFDQSDAAWEEDMGAYLGQTGIVLEADESSTEVRHNDSSEFWWANGALAREDHPTLLSSRARDGAAAAAAQTPVLNGSTPESNSVHSLFDGAAAAATGLFGSVSAAAGSMVSGAAAAVPAAPIVMSAGISPSAFLSSVTSQPEVLPSKKNRHDARKATQGGSSRSPTPDLAVAPLLDVTPSPAKAPGRSSVPASPTIADHIHNAAPARRSINISTAAQASHQPTMTTPEMTSAHDTAHRPNYSVASTSSNRSSATTGVHTPASPQRRFFFPPQPMNDRAHADSNGGQRGYVGINVTKQAPFVVLNAADVMDQHGVLQGHQGYSNIDVQPGDHLVRVDGHGVEFGGLKSLQNLLGGELGSTVELVFARNNAQFSIRALRHGAPTGIHHIPSSVGAVHVAGNPASQVGHFVGQPVVLDAPGVSQGVAAEAERGLKGHVQSEVERLKEKMERMEQEALDREERAKERERMKERERQLSARLRDLEGVVMTSVSRAESAKCEGAEPEGSATPKTCPGGEEGKVGGDERGSADVAVRGGGKGETSASPEADVSRGTEEAAAVLAAAKAEAAAILQQAEHKRSTSEANAASILKQAEEERAAAVSSALQPSLVAAAEARAEAILKQAQEQRIAAEKAAEDARAASVAVATATAELNRERERQKEEKERHSKPLVGFSDEESARKRVAGQGAGEEEMKEEGKGEREEAAAAAMQRLWKKKKSVQRSDAQGPRQVGDVAFVVGVAEEKPRDIARASGAADGAEGEQNRRRTCEAVVDGVRTAGPVEVGLGQKGPAEAASDAAARVIWRFWSRRRGCAGHPSALALGCISDRLQKSGTQCLAQNRAELAQSKAEAAIQEAANALAEAVAVAEEEGMASHAQGDAVMLEEGEQAVEGAGVGGVATREAMAAVDCSADPVTLDLVLDWVFADLAGREDEFKALLIEDVVFAVGADRERVRVLSLEAGSVLAKLELQEGVCGEATPIMVARELEKQARDNVSRLKYGRVTHKIQQIKNIQVEPPAQAPMGTHMTPDKVMLSFQDWEAEYGSAAVEDMHRVMQAVFSEVDVEKRGTISLEQWRSYLHRSMLTPPQDSRGSWRALAAALDKDTVLLEDAVLEEGDEDVDAVLRRSNGQALRTGASADGQGDGRGFSTRKTSGLQVDVESLDRDVAYSRMQYRKPSKSILRANSLSEAESQAAVELFLPDTDSPCEKGGRSWRQGCGRVLCCCCVGWDQFWRMRSCCAFCMHFLSAVCLILGLLLVGWEIGCNTMSGVSGFAWEEAWRESDPYCRQDYRVMLGCSGAGLLTLAWLFAFYAPPPQGWDRNNHDRPSYNELAERLKTLTKRFEESERLEDEYLRSTYSQIRKKKGEMTAEDENDDGAGGSWGPSPRGGVAV